MVDVGAHSWSSSTCQKLNTRHLLDALHAPQRSSCIKKYKRGTLNVFTKVTNYIKNSPLTVRLFAKLCEDMRVNYTSLLCYCEERWLSHAKVIQTVLELKEEIAIFLDENHNEDENMFREDNFIAKLKYLIEIFKMLCVFDKSMQGPQMHLLLQKSQVKAFEKKLDLWKSNLQKITWVCFHF